MNAEDSGRPSKMWFAGNVAPESMDFEETESVMWRKVSILYFIIGRFLSLCQIASIAKIFPGSRKLVDNNSQNHSI